ncbi:uncharacterized protein BDZ99DRAFT_568968 [Mytilinidion resinicola]|uniref:Uncharacterized protein n=1 Tax=Mytilinidion resinicola TaxID=574789 RepID=A0A6A6YTI8_9PEZI|nr:uncharacterized protein BDZ99DRAFT_568968 [Mytilinidion resinicola]KAF2812266.1 hypothetical protein BDZ99DRAFT_568968 [Mytilinidion resinicola]
MEILTFALFAGWVGLVRGATESSSSAANSTAFTSSSTNRVAAFILNGIGETGTSSSASPTVVSTESSNSVSASTAISSTSFSDSAVSSSSFTATLSQQSYVNPWVGNYSGTVAPSGTGSLYAAQCQNEWYSVSSFSDYLTTANSSTIWTTETIRSVTVTEVHTYYTTSKYTLCDGHPRFISSAPTATSTTLLPPSTTSWYALVVGLATTLQPNCSINFDDCAPLWSTYDSASSVYATQSFPASTTVVSLAPGASFVVIAGTTTSFPSPVTAQPTITIGTEDIEMYGVGTSWTWYIRTTPLPGGFLGGGLVLTPGGVATISHSVSTVIPPYKPHCNTDAPTCTPGAACTIGGGDVRLFYFPPQTNVSRDMCATAPVGSGVPGNQPPTNNTWTPITTGPYTVLPGNTTWFSGNVYVSLQTIGAHCSWSSQYLPVGQPGYEGEVLTLAPSDVFSLRATPYSQSGGESGVDYGGTQWPFNYADLQEPVPWSAWDGLNDCVFSRCTEISGSYNPVLAVPAAVRSLDPRWASCDLNLDGLYDPPWAVSSVGNFFPSTTTKDPGSPSATPGPGPPQSVNVPTNTPPKPPSSLGGIALPSSIDPSNGGNPSDPGDPGTPSNTPQPGVPQPHSSAAAGIPPVTTPNNPSDPGGNNSPPPLGPTTITTIGGQPIVGDPGTPGVITIGGTTTLAPGDPGTVISGTSLSVPDPSHVVVGGTTLTIPSATPAPAAPPLSVGGSPLLTNPSDPGTVVVGGTTLSAGGPGAVISGTSISVLDPGHIILSGPAGVSTLALLTPPPSSTPTGAIITAPNGAVFTATSLGNSVVIAGTTLSVGSPALTLPGGLVISDSPSGLIVGSSTIPFSALPVPTEDAVITLGGQVYTATELPGGSVMVAGTTLWAGGPAATIAGTVVSEARTGLVVGGATVPFETVAGASATGEGQAQFTGGVGRRGLSYYPRGT